MTRIINYVWCLLCGYQFWADETKQNQYICPSCGKIIFFKKENMRYIVDK